MKTFLRLLQVSLAVNFAIFAASVAAAASNPPEASDKARSKILVGTWDIRVEPGEEILESAWFTFRDNGTFASEGVLRLGKDTLRMKIEGKWRIGEGTLIEEVTKSSHPEFVPVGVITKDRILRLGEGELETRDEDGAIERFGKRKS